MSKRVVVFNHKGGVSKTTSTYNIGWMMSQNNRILLVDADPQCNLTGLFLGDSFEEYYFDNKTRFQNIKDGVAPAFAGKPIPIEAVTCVTTQRAQNLFLLAGHANLSAYDSALTFAQTSNNAIATLQNLPGAFSRLLQLTEERYAIDYTIIDLNPGLSAINQNLFLISDAFIIPTNPDPFSLMALDTLKTILPQWANWKNDAIGLFAESAYPLKSGNPKFLGSLIQRFNVRRGRAALPYRNNISEINNNISTKLVPALATSGMTLAPSEYGDDLIGQSYCLSEIPDFAGLLPKAHEAGVPIYALRDDEIHETGPVFDTLVERRESFRLKFIQISQQLVREVAYA